MSFFVGFFLGLALLLVALGAFAIVAMSKRPDTFELSRSVVIDAPRRDVYELINDFRRWTEWSPWEHLDPQLERTYEGETAGVGSIYRWNGNRKAGAGRMEIVGASPTTSLEIQLDFFKPVKAHNLTIFQLENAAQATSVTWTMSGEYNHMSKLMSLVYSMDNMVGPDFERGLAQLKAAVESHQPAA